MKEKIELATSLYIYLCLELEEQVPTSISNVSRDWFRGDTWVMEALYQYLQRLDAEEPNRLRNLFRWSNGFWSRHLSLWWEEAQEKGPLHVDITGVDISIKYFNGQFHFYKDNQLHREDGPAQFDHHGNYTYYLHGLEHRVDGPASFHFGTKTWKQKGKYYRRGGQPVIEYANGDVARLNEHGCPVRYMVDPKRQRFHQDSVYS